MSTRYEPGQAVWNLNTDQKSCWIVFYGNYYEGDEIEKVFRTEAGAVEYAEAMAARLGYIHQYMNKYGCRTWTRDGEAKGDRVYIDRRELE